MTTPGPTPAQMQKARELRETLANLCHEQWSGWMKYLFSKSLEVGDGGEEIPAAFIRRWKRQMTTPYAELSESEQDSDRTEADKFIAVFARALADAAHEQMERDCKAVCSLCREFHQGVEGVGAAHLRYEASWVHTLTLSTRTQSLFGCDAAPIRAACAASGKE